VSDDFRPAPSDAEALAATIERERRTSVVLERASELARLEGIPLERAHARAVAEYDEAAA
jgi:hypothetical protein